MSKYPLKKVSSFLQYRDDTLNPSEANALGLRRIEKINFNGSIFLTSKATNTKMIRVRKGDLVISGINVGKGALAVYEGDEDVLATIHYSGYVFDKSKIDLEYLKLFLKSDVFVAILKDQTGGGIKTEIKPKKFLSLEVPLPTITEQHDIVKNYMAVNDQIDGIILQVNKQENYLNHLLQAIFQMAVEGNLVAQYENDEPATVLLNRIKNEKSMMSSTNGDSRNSKIYYDDNVREDDKYLLIPKNWCWCKLNSLIQQLPRNGYSPARVDRETSTKVLTLTATTSGYFIDSAFKYCNKIIDPLSYLWLKKEDILIQRSNSLEYVGVACLYNSDNNAYIYPDLMMKIKCMPEIVSKYIVIVLKSRYLRIYFQNKAKGTSKSMPKITQMVVANAVIPLPPRAEQQRIVEKVDQLVAMCDELKRSIKTSKQNATLLMQTVLNQAFSGKANYNVKEFPQTGRNDYVEEWDIAAKANSDIKQETAEKIAAILANVSKGSK